MGTMLSTIITMRTITTITTETLSEESLCPPARPVWLMSRSQARA